MKLQIFNSLRGRYAFGSIFLGALILIGSIFTNHYVTGARQTSVENLEKRNNLLQHSRMVRDSVWKSREALEKFLIEPDNNRHRDQVFISLREADLHSQALSTQPWISTEKHNYLMAQLKNTIKLLKQGATELVKTRSDSNKQYPVISAARKYMLPNHRIFYTEVSLAIDEQFDELLDNIAKKNINTVAYQALIQARYLWTQMISTFRMYLANRVGSFELDTMAQQEKEVALFYIELRNQLNILKKIDKAGNLGIQASASLPSLTSAADDWNTGFLETQRIHATDNWRADSKLLKITIHPLLESIWGLLLSIDESIEKSSNRDVSMLSKITRDQSKILWLLTGIGLLIIGTGFIFLEQLILKPIATVSRALKDSATGVKGIELPTATSHETKDLIDAFTEMNKQVNARQIDLEYQAMHDALTGLPNRTLLIDRLQQAILNSRREHKYLALLIMDLNGFKEVNDTVGHQFGDSLLIEVGIRLLETIREVDTVARLGGDEFAILLPDSNEVMARKLALKICKVLEEVFEIDELRLYISASLGIASYPEHGNNATTLIQRADVAMYVAKRSKSDYAVYNPKDDQHSVGKLALMSDLRNALDQNTLHLHYQPKVSIKNNSVVGVEALLRWNHPKYGAIPPDEIIPHAEQTGLIKPLTLWVLGEAIRQCRKWHDNNIHLNVGVNLSVYNLQDLGLVDEIREALLESNLQSKSLNLEITESAMMSNPTNAVEILNQLDAMGVRLAIDDFGTGFSSLAYLKQLPVDELKIDKSFVIKMTADDNDAIIVRSTIDLAHNLGLKVIAEGVEDKEVLDLLEILGCDMAQGYFIARPMSAIEFEQWLEKRTRQNNTSNVITFVR